jgi:hypothetical protein
MDGMTLSGWPLAALRFFLLASASILLSEVAARLGAGFLKRGGRGGPGSLIVFGAGLLLGWGLLGLANLGLALTGLFYPALVIILPVFLAVVSTTFRERWIFLVDAVRSFGAVGGWGMLAVLAALAPLVPHLLVPEGAQDSYSYHLGAPWQFLVAHRALISNVFMDFHLPLPLEMAFALPLSLGFERLARWIVLAHFLAAGAVWAGWCLEQGKRASAWLGIVLPLSLLYLPWNLTMTKCDAAAASLVVAGAVMLWRERRSTAMALFGLGIAAKMVYGPVVALLILASPRPFARPWRTGALLAAPVLAWWVKAWLAVNNPLFPLATGFFPTLDWDARNNMTYESYIRPLESDDTRSWSGLPRALFRHLGQDSPLVPLLVPVLFIFSGRRREALALLLAGVILLRAGHVTRFLVPVSWLLLALAALEAGRLPARWKNALLGCLAAWAASRAFINPLLQPAPWEDAKSPFHSALDARLVTFGDAVRALGELKPARVLTLGELATYRIPSRVVFSGYLGITPLIWKSVRESHDERELSRRFRQLGNPLILHNIVGSIWRGYRYQSFKWDRRMFTLYYGFSRRRLDLVRGPDRFDTGKGIYYIFRFQRDPREGSYHPVARHFLPGVSMVLAETRMLRNANRTDEAVAQANRLLEIMPGLGIIRSEEAFALNMAGRHAEAYKILKPMMATGVVDTKNMIAFGASAVEVGDYEGADRALEWSLAHYPNIQPYLRVDRAEVWRRKAQAEWKRGDRAAAETSLARSAEMLSKLPPTMIPEVEKYRRINMAELAGLRGDLARAGGRRGEAALCYREALSYGAAVPESTAAKWRLNSAE